LKDRLGPVLFQLPPQFKMDLDRLRAFLNALEPHMSKPRRRCVIEIRNSSWLVRPVFELLRAHNVALCFADWRDSHVTEPLTADFVYVRRHSGRGMGGNYPKKDLDRDIELIRKWVGEGLEVYMYFNNDLGGHAIRNARYVNEALKASLNAGSDTRRRVAS
jgi:uncharacterized protein YecE (DUF72 family)